MRRDLNRIVLDALSKCHDDPKRATNLIVKTASGELKQTLAVLGARQIVRDFYHSARRSAMSISPGRLLDNTSDVSQRIEARIARRAFWDNYTLFGQTRLKDATKDMLIESANARKEQAAGDLRCAAFEMAIARKLPENFTVKQKFTDAEIIKMSKRFVA